jgi:hypothetical protein
LGQPIHTLVDLGQHVSIFDFFFQFMFFHDFFGNERDGDSRIFRSVQQCVEIKICYIHGAKLCIWGGHYAIEEDFGCFQFGCACTFVTWIVDFVAANCHLRLMALCFLWALRAYKTWVRGLAILRHFMVMNECYCVSSFNATPYSLC